MKQSGADDKINYVKMLTKLLVSDVLQGILYVVQRPLINLEYGSECARRATTRPS